MDAARRLGDRLDAATAHLPAPLAVVDLDRFDANARQLVARSAGVPVRVASKSVRVRALIARALAHDGFAGVMAYSVREALWLVEHGADDVLVAYPSVDRAALAEVAASHAALAAVTVMVDDAAHVDLLRALGAPVRVCLDVDASLRIGRGRAVVHLGTRRSPLRTADQVAGLAADAHGAGLDVRGVMFYEAQVAGLPDSSAAVRLVKRASVSDLVRRRRRIVDAVAAAVGHPLALVNAGGTGSLETSSADPVVTEVTAGSGLFVPTLFDDYRAFDPRPAAFFGHDVVRTSAPGWATVFGGGYAASGAAGPSRLPRPVEPGWRLTSAEGAGEVQTPLRARGSGRLLEIGDRVWFRNAKAGEPLERFTEVHLVRGDETVETVPTYRGEGQVFG
ncbi:alanine racemase [Paraoerskovia marina]|uniref:alanine racemase n=1 Tax=Paraoerskovia marina TaxID=545619 RepID=UPI000492E197|nr:alanine racemase [Paraoerskovia marina]